MRCVRGLPSSAGFTSLLEGRIARAENVTFPEVALRREVAKLTFGQHRQFWIGRARVRPGRGVAAVD